MPKDKIFWAIKSYVEDIINSKKKIFLFLIKQ